MAYGSSNPPFLRIAAVAGGFNFGNNSGAYGGNSWAYVSSDPVSTVLGSSYFSNGFKLGMRKWDDVLVIDTGTTAATYCFVSAVTTQATGSQGGAGATISRASTGA